MSSNLLVIDLGNTNIVLGVYRGDSLLSSWRLATARERTADEYGILARQLVGDLHSKLEGAIVASVVPPLNGAMTFMVQKYFGVFGQDTDAHPTRGGGRGGAALQLSRLATPLHSKY